MIPLNLPIPPLDRPVLASWTLTNPAAPDWSESGSCAVYWHHENKTWCRLSDGAPLRQAPGDKCTITARSRLPLPATRALALAEGRLA